MTSGAKQVLLIVLVGLRQLDPVLVTVSELLLTPPGALLLPQRTIFRWAATFLRASTDTPHFLVEPTRVTLLLDYEHFTPIRLVRDFVLPHLRTYGFTQPVVHTLSMVLFAAYPIPNYILNGELLLFLGVLLRVAMIILGTSLSPPWAATARAATARRAQLLPFVIMKTRQLALGLGELHLRPPRAMTVGATLAMRTAYPVRQVVLHEAMNYRIHLLPLLRSGRRIAWQLLLLITYMAHRLIPLSGAR